MSAGAEVVVRYEGKPREAFDRFLIKIAAAGGVDSGYDFMEGMRNLTFKYQTLGAAREAEERLQVVSGIAAKLRVLEEEARN